MSVMCFPDHAGKWLGLKIEFDDFDLLLTLLMTLHCVTKSSVFDV